MGKRRATMKKKANQKAREMMPKAKTREEISSPRNRKAVEASSPRRREAVDSRKTNSPRERKERTELPLHYSSKSISVSEGFAPEDATLMPGSGQVVSTKPFPSILRVPF